MKLDLHPACLLLYVATLALLASGCPSEYVSCESSDDCPLDQVCIENICRDTCNASSECFEGLICHQGACVPPRDITFKDATVADAVRVDRRDAGEHDTLLQLDAEAPDFWQPDVRQADVSRPDHSPTDTSLLDMSTLPDVVPSVDSMVVSLDVPQPDTIAHSDAGQAPDIGTVAIDVPGTDAARPDTAYLDVPRPDAPQPDTLLPDTAYLDVPLPDGCSPLPGPTWWDDSYQTRFPIDLGAVPVDYTVELVLTDLVAGALFNASSSSGEDLTVVHHGPITTRAIDRELAVFSSNRVLIRFMVQEPGGFTGGSKTYYIYIGKQVMLPPMRDLGEVYLFHEDFDATSVDSRPAGFSFHQETHWRVVDHGGSNGMRAQGDGRHLAEITSSSYDDVSISARLRLESANGFNNCGFFVRGTQLAPLDDLWLWVAQLRQADSQLAISEYDGARNVVATWDMTVDLAHWYQIEVRVVGDSMDLLVDGLNALSATNNDVGTQIGLYGYSPDAIYDDVKVRRLVDPAPSVALGAAEHTCN